MATYTAALIDKDGNVVNTVVVDDAVRWDVPEGLGLYRLDRGENAESGGTFDGTMFVKRPDALPPPKDELTLTKERLAAVETRLAALEVQTPALDGTRT